MNIYMPPCYVSTKKGGLAENCHNNCIIDTKVTIYGINFKIESDFNPIRVFFVIFVRNFICLIYIGFIY